MPGKIITSLIVLALLLPAVAAAVEEAAPKTSEGELEQRLLELQTQIIEMQKRHAAEMAAVNAQLETLINEVAAIKKSNGTTSPAPVTAAVQPQAPPQDYSAPAAGGEVFNPKISVISDFLAGFVDQSGDSADDMLVREVELGFSGHVDTWGRYDLTIAFHNHPGLELAGDNDGHDHTADGLNTEIEEGYFTFLTLPADLQARVGKIRNRVGKTNPTHLHSLQWVDYPRVIQAYLGEEGLSGSGASISWLAPWSRYTEVTYEFMKLDGEGSSGVFDEEADGYSHILHANTFFELGENHNLELGLSSMISPTSPHLGNDDSWLNGIDLTYRWDPAGDGTFRRLEWRTELYSLRRSLDSADHDHEAGFTQGYPNPHLSALDVVDEEEHGIDREDFFGMFSSLSYRLNRRLEATGRFDYFEGPFDPGLSETGWSAYLTYWQSEYAYWRLGWMRTEQELENADFDPVNRLWLQFNLSLGPHPAHKY